jgi:hypothetical protein
MKSASLLAALGLVMLGSLATTASAQINVYAGYLNNVTGQPDPAVTPNPFNPDANTILISSGPVDSPHDTGVIRFQNLCDMPVSIDPGLNVVTSGATFQLWDGGLPVVLAPGQNLVLAETVNYNFDASDAGLGIDPIVSGSVDGTAFSFTDKARILLGHEDVTNTPETTPYGLLGTIPCAAVPEPGALAFVGAGMGSLLAAWRSRRRK